MVDPESFRGSPQSVSPHPERRKCVRCSFPHALIHMRSSCTDTEFVIAVWAENRGTVNVQEAVRDGGDLWAGERLQA